MGRYLLFFLFMTFALPGCANMQPVLIKAIKKNSASFVIGQVQETNTGEPMVVEENLVFYKAPVAITDYRPPSQLGTNYPWIKKRMTFTPYGKLDNGDILYANPDLRPTLPNGDHVKWDYCIAVNEAGEAYGDAACVFGIVRTWEDKPEGVVEMKVVHREGSVKRELVYNGKSNNTIKVAYREYRYNFAAPDFYQDLTYDLAESNTIRFKNMVIEVLNAGNSTIKFIVKSEMRGPAPAQENSDTRAPSRQENKGSVNDI